MIEPSFRRRGFTRSGPDAFDTFRDVRISLTSCSRICILDKDVCDGACKVGSGVMLSSSDDWAQK
jgi:hypothetical protein